MLTLLKRRFEENPGRHGGLSWQGVEKRMLKGGDVLTVLTRMEETGGEPDVMDLGDGTITFVDCAKESPEGRRSLCYDRTALEGRKANKPANSVLDMAAEIGVELLTEELYRKLQERGEFDLKTSSWILTPEGIRKKGGALFCDRRYGQVFTYHNGAESYYASRGFRGCLRL